MPSDGSKIIVRLTDEEKRRYEELAKAKGSRSAAARLATILRAELLLEDGLISR